MNESNFKEITETWLPRHGFPQGVLDGQILDMMKNNPDKITARATDMMGQDKMEYAITLGKNPNKPEDQNLYLNSIAVTMSKADGEVRKHEFQIFYNQGYNLEQMNNIMDGRSVHKTGKNNNTGETYQIWYALDLNKKDEKGYNLGNPSFENTTGFNLAREVSKIPLGNMSPEDKNNLLRDLKNGNEVQANIKLPDGSTERAILVALPHINQVGAYNSEGKRIQVTKSTMQAVSATTAALVAGATSQNPEGGKKLKAG